MASFHGIGCSEAFSEVKGGELIFSNQGSNDTSEQKL